MPIIRAASHAGSWYTGTPAVLDRQIEAFLSKGPSVVPGARILVGPHAGYAYAGPTLAKTYGVFDASDIDRVFIMGPSHHVYFKGCVMTTACDAYSTPLGDLPVDKETISRLIKADPKLFKKMSLDVDEDEHCFEMHMPFLYKVTSDASDKVPKIIPIMISATDEKFERKLAADLKPYFEDKHNAFIITSDFCHWGSRFGYTAYSPDGTVEKLGSSPRVPKGGLEIYKSIESIDKEAMKVASTGSYKSFRRYLADTENTICGAKPLSVLLNIMENYYQSGADDKFQWNGYAQSSHVTSPYDSSVSYGSGFAVI